MDARPVVTRKCASGVSVLPHLPRITEGGGRREARSHRDDYQAFDAAPHSLRPPPPASPLPLVKIPARVDELLYLELAEPVSYDISHSAIALELSLDYDEGR